MKKPTHNIMAALGVLAVIATGAGAAHAGDEQSAERRAAIANSLADEACVMYLPGNHAEYHKCYRTIINSFRR